MEHEEIEILVVEDNPDDLELMIRSFKKHHLINKIHIAENGEEAMDFINCTGKFTGRDIDRPPKVILLDLKLPKVDGMQVLKHLKTNDSTKKIPVIIVTSSREDPDISKAYNLGANSYVVKPINFTDFMNKMNQIGLYWLAVNEKPR